MKSLYVSLLAISVFLSALPVRAAILERVIAKVNGEIITLSDFEEREFAAIQTQGVPPDHVQEWLQTHTGEILQQAVDDVLLVQKADELGIKVRPDALDSVIADLRKENHIDSEEQFE